MLKLLHRIFIGVYNIVFDIKIIVSVIHMAVLSSFTVKFNKAYNFKQELVQKVTQGNWDPEIGQVILQWEFSLHHW